MSLKLLILNCSVFYPSKCYSVIHTRLLENLKAKIPQSINTWSDMDRQQTAKAKKGLLLSVLYRSNTGGARSALRILFQCICKLFRRKCDVRIFIQELQNFGILLRTVIGYIAFYT